MLKIEARTLFAQSRARLMMAGGHYTGGGGRGVRDGRRGARVGGRGGGGEVFYVATFLFNFLSKYRASICANY